MRSAFSRLRAIVALRGRLAMPTAVAGLVGLSVTVFVLGGAAYTAVLPSMADLAASKTTQAGSASVLGTLASDLGFVPEQGSAAAAANTEDEAAEGESSAANGSSASKGVKSAGISAATGSLVTGDAAKGSGVAGKGSNSGSSSTNKGNSGTNSGSSSKPSSNGSSNSGSGSNSKPSKPSSGGSSSSKDDEPQKPADPDPAEEEKLHSVLVSKLSVANGYMSRLSEYTSAFRSDMGSTAARSYAGRAKTLSNEAYTHFSALAN